MGCNPCPRSKSKMDKSNNISDSGAKPLKIQIPKGISLAVIGDKRARKLLDTFLILKSAYKSGTVKIDGNSMNELAALCGRSSKTVKNRIKELAADGLVKYSKDLRFIYLCKWEHLCVHYGISPLFRFYYVKKTPGKTVEDVLEALAMKEKEKECARAAQYKLHQSDSNIQSEIVQVAGKTLEAVAHCQLYHDLTDKKCLPDDVALILFSVLRGDTSISSKKWSELFGYESKGGMAYKKRKLANKGLIVVTKREWKLGTGTHTTRKRRKCVSGSVVWIQREKELKFVACDSITYLNPSLELPANAEKI